MAAHRIQITKVLLLLTFFLSPPMLLADEQTLLLRQPAITKEHLAFVYGGDIWLTNRQGKQARRLTSHPARESNPHFSPDGQWIAFSANYDNNLDVYIIPTEGGQPKRLTWHSGDDIVNGWSADGENILFTSAREIKNARSYQAWHVPIAGGFPQKVMEGLVAEGVWSGDGERFAYRPNSMAHRGASGWRQHRGGSTPPIWIIDPKTQQVEKIPHERASDSNPMWLGNQVYFISDRNDGAANLFQYDINKRTIKQLTRETLWDIRNADAYGKHIVYETGGRLKELDTETLDNKELVISIKADSPQLRAQWKDASTTIQKLALSPSGKRALLTARGDVFTVPISDGSTRNLTHSANIREKDALWSPQGDKIAYISDQGSQHRLVVTDQLGLNSERYELGDPAYYTLRAWTPDGRRIIYQDNHLKLYSIMLDSGKRTPIATEKRRSDMALSVSADSRWLAYSAAGDNYFNDIFLHNLETGEHARLTDGMVHADSPTFSKDGKYLYFAASNNAGPLQSGLEMSTRERPLRNAIYAVVLASDEKSPLLPKSDEEAGEVDKGDKEEKGEEESKLASIKVDLDGINERITALPMALRNYAQLSVAHDGSLYYTDQAQPGVSRELPDVDTSSTHSLYRFDFSTRKPVLVQKNITDYVLSEDGEHLLIQGEKAKVSYAKIKQKLQPETLNLTDVKSFIDPRQEWQQILDETWRMERDYFYAANMHDLDWEAIRERYEALLTHVTTREDLNELLVEMIAEMQVGHNRISGGDVHRGTPVTIGLLGADFRVENSHYRIHKIYTGERWNPFLKAPLAAPGMEINEGDYIIAINGVEITPTENIFSRFEGTVGKQVTLTVNSEPQPKGAKKVIVEPIAKDDQLRRWHWIEQNRAYVDKESNGRVGYIYLPDTQDGGFRYFNRMFFAQINKEALIIDERRNSGGQVANYITDILTRQQLAGWKERDGLNWNTPAGAVYGPKVMLIDQDAGSGGDFLPYAFRRLEIGKLIGTRTWGGLIGISANPDLIDGGNLVVPFFRFYTPESQWAIENEGIAPDIEVELETADTNRGIDTQLERAIDEINEQLKGYKEIKVKQAPPVPTSLGQ
ncbi:MAG: PDZ domain-containing protein [Gammaproteobacteria bacterium]|nr:PDZ domain-containing protein [Gammaproteobacteria bacterium]